MTGRVEGKVAFITGAARGQGRSHAVRLAEEGADIIAVDIAEDIESVRRFYPGATEGDLAETVKEVEALDRRIVATKADVRDYGALKAALDDTTVESIKPTATALIEVVIMIASSSRKACGPPLKPSAKNVMPSKSVHWMMQKNARRTNFETT